MNRRRIAALLLALAVSGGVASARIGDVNGDDAITLADALQVCQFVGGTLPALDRPENADIDGDGEIGSNDATDILEAALGLLRIESPQNLALFSVPTVQVSGTVGPDAQSVEVNGVVAQLSTDTPPIFSAQVALNEGSNLLTAVALRTSGAVDTASVHVTLDTEPPRITIDTPLDGAVTTSPSVTVAGMVIDAAPGTTNAEQVDVTVNGIAAQVANRQFVVGDIPLAAGVNLITATATDRSGNSAGDSVSVTYDLLPDKPHIRLISGNNQSSAINTTLAQPLVVELVDGDGVPVAGENVIFRVTENNGVVNAKRAVVVVSGADGRAQATWTLGSRAGAGINRLRASAVGFEGPVVFTASGGVTGATRIVMDDGNNQTGAVDRQLPEPLSVIVTDVGHNRLQGVPVTFTVLEGEGSVAGGEQVTVETDSNGAARVALTLGPDEGNDNNVVEAAFPGNPGAAARFAASGRRPGDSAETRVSGVVLDNTNLPIAGVTVGIEGTALETLTDDQGQFELQPAPIGTVHVVVDGSTASRPGVWPTLAFELVTVAGHDNTVGMPIYLLPIDVAGGLFVDEITGGTLTLPETPGFSLEIEPGAVTFPDGSRSGVVSVTTVHADKVPMTPNFGQQPRLIVTIQPAGAHFDPPAPISIPNVENLAPGEKTEMYSFDHDLEMFVAIGTGTVTEDGSVIASDPGVGIVKGGWHCGGNPQPTGAAEPAHISITDAGGEGEPAVLRDPTTNDVNRIILPPDSDAVITFFAGPIPGEALVTSSDTNLVNVTADPVEQGGLGGFQITTGAVGALATATLTIRWTCGSGASISKNVDVFITPIDIAMAGVPENRETTVGGFIGVDDEAPAMVELRASEVGILETAGTNVDQEFTLSAFAGGQRFMVWLDEERTQPLPLPQTWNPGVIAEGPPDVVYVEAIAPSGGNRDIALEFESRLFIRFIGTTLSTVSDTLRLTAFEVDMDATQLGEPNEVEVGVFVGQDDDPLAAQGTQLLTFNVVPSTLDGFFELALATGDQLVRFVDPVSGTVTELDSLDPSLDFGMVNGIPPSLILGGREPSADLRDVTLQFTYHTPPEITRDPFVDEIRATVIGVELEVEGLFDEDTPLPSVYLIRNDDDDNQNLLVDRHPEERGVVNENDLRQVTLRVLPAAINELGTGYHLNVEQFIAIPELLAFWGDPTKSAEPLLFATDASPIDALFENNGGLEQTVWVEGFETGLAGISGGIVITPFDGPLLTLTRPVSLLVETVNVTFADVMDEEEVDPGGTVGHNNDDDNANGMPDKLDVGMIVDEDNLTELIIEFSAPSEDMSITLLNSDPTKATVWASENRVVSLNGNIDHLDFSTGRRTLLIEGIDTTEDEQFVEIKVLFTLTPPNGGPPLIQSDVVRFIVDDGNIELAPFLDFFTNPTPESPGLLELEVAAVLGAERTEIPLDEVEFRWIGSGFADAEVINLLEMILRDVTDDPDFDLASKIAPLQLNDMTHLPEVTGAGVNIVIAETEFGFSNPMVVLAGLRLDSIEIAPSLGLNTPFELAAGTVGQELNLPLILAPTAGWFDGGTGTMTLADVEFKLLNTFSVSGRVLGERMGDIVGRRLARAFKSGAKRNVILALLRIAAQQVVDEFVDWESNNEAVASVTGGGWVTGNAPGLTSIEGTLDLNFEDYGLPDFGEASDTAMVWVLPDTEDVDIVRPTGDPVPDIELLINLPDTSQKRRAFATMTVFDFTNAANNPVAIDLPELPPLDGELPSELRDRRLRELLIGSLGDWGVISLDSSVDTIFNVGGFRFGVEADFSCCPQDQLRFDRLAFSFDVPHGFPGIDVNWIPNPIVGEPELHPIANTEPDGLDLFIRPADVGRGDLRVEVRLSWGRQINPPFDVIAVEIFDDCGNGALDAGEECDDGPANSDIQSDACRTNCMHASCGDGVADSDELCDDGPANSDEMPDACRTDCLNAGCGDGVVDTGEACDEGENNSEMPDATCRTDCTLSTCGDNVVDMGEECDEGQDNSDTVVDSCRTDCRNAHCGDGVQDTGEDCDNGENNSDDTPDACRLTCTLPFCGDGVPDTGEECDDGPSNSDEAADACRFDCTEPFCGDGTVDSDEECDRGENNSDTMVDGCRTDCRDAHCGDGVLDTAEVCDNGVDNSDSEPDSCRTDCLPARCGDGVLDTVEECDEGENNSDTVADACRTDCVEAFCGDGTVDSNEQCDDGPGNPDEAPDACRTDCTNPTCGDGVQDMDEECDDGELNSDLLIDACRTDCTAAGCGDGVVDTGEECDDGPANSNTVPDACRTDCMDAGCGDGVLDTGEDCDAGDDNSDIAADACRTDCTNPTCGDGVQDTGEECDNGAANSNTVANACRTDCTLPICGDNVVDDGEGCDPPGAAAGPDGNVCRGDCSVCGDGNVDAGEECDNGVLNSDTTASACRTDCRVHFCGDGVNDLDETCDPPGDPAGTNGNACRGDCSVCGDGIVDVGESCDDGNSNNADACRNDCTSCGDGTLDADETCDPPGQPAGGNGNDCEATCTVCGDANVDPGEECDDGDGDNGDTCTNDCEVHIVLPTLVINEIVVEPQRDWDDSGGDGNGVPFDDTPGTSTAPSANVDSADQWIELAHLGVGVLGLAGWTLEFDNGGAISTVDLSGEFPGPGDYVIVGAPASLMTTTILHIKDALGNLKDEVDLGELHTLLGNATGTENEALARVPDELDTGDPGDFQRRAATIDAANPDL